MKNPSELPKIAGIPDVLVMENGTRVKSFLDWEARRKEIRQLYEYYMYGPMPDASNEKVTYVWESMEEQEVLITLSDENKEKRKVRVGKLRIQIEREGRKSSFSTIVTLPCTQPPKGGYPLYSEMAFLWGDAALQPSNNQYYAAGRGYASVVWAPTDIAADNASRTGVFYTLYPYGKTQEEQTGALVAWAWGAGKILDAMAAGAALQYDINWKNNILGGVSRFGKATAVAGAYDARIKVVVPACSGAGGLAMYRYFSQGKTYDFGAWGYQNEEGTSTHTTDTNEYLGCLQSADEGHWFNDTFKKFESVEQFPMDQHFLAALIAAPDRHLFIIHAIIGEDWTNPAAMSLTYAAANQLYESLGLGDHIQLCVHLQGHAIILSDMIALLDYCDLIWYEKRTEKTEGLLQKLKTSPYLEGDNYDEEAFGIYRAAGCRIF